MWLGFIVLTLISAQAMEQARTFPKVSTYGHHPIQVRLGGFKKVPKGIYSIPTAYVCLKCGKHLMQAFDFEGYVSEGEPCSETEKENTTLVEILQRLERFEEFNKARNTRSHSI